MVRADSSPTLDSLAGWLDSRELPDRGASGPALRMSALGKCARQLAYRMAGTRPDGHETDHRGYRTFRMGDQIEENIVEDLERELSGTGWKIKYAGKKQLRVRLVVGVKGVGNVEIWGSGDGVLIDPDNQPALLEIKSMNRAAFDWRLKQAQPENWKKYKGKPGEYNAGGVGSMSWTDRDGYYHQNQGYMHGWSSAFPDGFTRSVVIAEDKDSQARISWLQYRNSEAWLPQIREHLYYAHLPLPEVPRRLPDGQIIEPASVLSESTGKPLKGHGELGFPCTYCPYYRHCWPGVEDTFATDRSGRSKRVLVATNNQPKDES